MPEQPFTNKEHNMTIIYYRYFSTMMLITLVAFMAGCGGSSGPKTYLVEGTVTHNGTPVEGASVSFVPSDSSGTSAGGRTDASGKYTLMASSGAVGAAPGIYAVTISKREGVATGKKVPTTDENGQEIMVDEMVAKETLPADYASSQKTPLKAITVEAKSPNTHDFDLK